MRRPRRLAVIAAVAVVTPALASTGMGAAHGENRSPYSPYASREGDSWVGIDGQTHQSTSAKVVAATQGSDELFAAWEFDDACRAGEDFLRGLRTMSRVAKVIRKSGRRVIWTVGPNKSSVLTHLLDLTTLPHGSCALQGLADQQSLLDNYPSRDYQPLRTKVASSKRQTYWRGDIHWSSVGASIWVKDLARRLDPRLAKRQQWYSTVASYWGLLYQYSDVPTSETAPAVRPTKFVKVRRTRGIEPDAALPTNDVLRTGPITDLAWRTKPARATWPGRTLLIGDSFTLSAVELLRPLFHHGRFLWFKAEAPEKIAKAVVRSDTVVLELVQVGVALWGAEAMPALLRAVRTALADAPRRGSS